MTSKCNTQTETNASAFHSLDANTQMRNWCFSIRYPSDMWLCTFAIRESRKWMRRTTLSTNGNRAVTAHISAYQYCDTYLHSGSFVDCEFRCRGDSVIRLEYAKCFVFFFDFQVDFNRAFTLFEYKITTIRFINARFFGTFWYFEGWPEY